MSEIERAADWLRVSESTLKEFDAYDPFNNNQIKGFICRESTKNYGALIITYVNGASVPQRILATPKLRYPFGRTGDGDRQYHFPATDEVRAYEKWDGTNICAYSYRDMFGDRYVTFKTRLTPVLRQTHFGDFLGMWNEILQRYPGLRSPSPVKSGEFALSFEMYGHRNPVTVRYRAPLDTALLFGVSQTDGSIVIPEQVTGVPKDVVFPAEFTAGNREDLVAIYEESRAAADLLNVKEDDGMIAEGGTEGYVFYLKNNRGFYEMFKCKPETIEALHWASDSIPLDVIKATAWNALESCDDELTIAYVVELLCEEFTETQVSVSGQRIARAVGSVRSRLAWRTRVREEYEAIGLKFTPNTKRTIMRRLSQKFNRSEMSRVFGALREIGVAN